MKKKKMFSKILAMVLVLSLMLSAFPSLSVFAQEVSSEEKLTEKGELWQPETNSNALNFEGDLSLEELETAKLADEDMPEIVGQDNIEEKGHVNRLWEQEEDLNSIVFQNRDGTKTMYYYNYPVKYKDANGKIKDKSNKISQTSSGDFTNAENDINTYFPKKLNKNKGVVLKFDNYTVEMAPDIKGNSGASRQTGHNKYFDPTEYVQYPDVFDDGISLRYTPTFEGYKEDIVLSEYTGINEFSFRLYTDGLSLAMNEDGSYYLIDPLSGEIKTQIGDLVVYDSKPFDVPDEILNESVSNPTEEDYAKKEATLKELIESVPIESSTTEEQPGSLNTYSHQYRVETVKQDNEYLITIVVDEDYLTDSERVYPVYVDPTISVSGSGTSKTIQDAPIYANKPSITSGGNTYNVVGYQGSTYGVGRTLMKFPGLSSNSTYANLSSNQITSLQLHIYEGSGSTNNACIDLWQYNGTNWTESTAKCNNVGWNSYSNNFTWNYINCSGWQTFNLTSMVATWKSSSTALNKGIMLKNYTSESSSGYSKHFLSTESNYKPYLTYTYNVMPTQVTLSQSSKKLNANDSFNLYATVYPSNTSQAVYWESSNTDVATVSNYGLVCANGEGTTTITARSKLNGSVYATCTVTSTNFQEGSITTPENANAITSWNESQSCFDSISWSAEYEVWYTTAMVVANGGGALGNTDAKDLFLTFLTCMQTTPKSIALNRMILESPKANANFVKDINKAIAAAEIALQNKSSTTLSTVSEFTYNNLAYDSSLGNLVNNWHLAIGAYRTWMTATVTRSGGSYTMTIQYNLRDIYDWNPNNTNMGLIVSQSQMHTLHEAGMAREYKVVGNTSVRVTWNSGQTLGNGASWTYV